MVCAFMESDLSNTARLGPDGGVRLPNCRSKAAKRQGRHTQQSDLPVDAKTLMHELGHFTPQGSGQGN
jgi:hypothetical protein